MSFQFYSVFGWSKRLDLLQSGLTYKDGAEFFATTKPFVQSIGPAQKSPIVDSTSKQPDNGTVEIGMIGRSNSKSPQKVTFKSGADDVSFYSRPHLNPGDLRVSMPLVGYGTGLTTYDMKLANNNDILYTQFPGLAGRGNSATRVYASYAQNADVLLGSGLDVIIGGAGQDRVFSDPKTTGSKVVIGGSHRDVVSGSSDADYLVGDVHATSDSVYYSDPANPDFYPNPSTIGERLGADGKPTNVGNPFSYHNKLIDATRVSVLGDIGDYKNHLSGYDYYYETRLNGSKINPASKSFRATKLNSNGIGAQPIYPLIWHPFGDTIFAGAGDDISFGDDDAWTGKDLINYKQKFGDTLDALKNWAGWIHSGYEWMVNVEKDPVTKANRQLSTYEIPVWQANQNGVRVRLGDDEIFAGDGNDILYGGFGSDLLVGGKGIDIIFAPAHILVEGMDPLWGEATVIYGDEFSVDGDAVNDIAAAKSSAQIDKRRFGYSISNGVKAYDNWREALTPNPDHFVFEAPIYTEKQLEGWKEDYGSVTRSLSGSDNDPADGSSTAHYAKAYGELAVDTSINLLQFLPGVGGGMSFVLGLLKSLLMVPAPEKELPTKPEAADRYRIVRDFDIWDTLTYVNAVGDTTESSFKGVAIAEDAASRKYKNQGYETIKVDTTDTVIDYKGKNGSSTIVLNAFTFKSAFNEFIGALKQAERARADDVTGAIRYTVQPLAELKVPLGTEFSNFYEPAKAKNIELSRALECIASTWGENYFVDNTSYSSDGGYETHQISSRLFDSSTIDALRSAGFALAAIPSPPV